MAVQSSAFIFALCSPTDVVRRSERCLRSDAGALIVAMATSLGWLINPEKRRMHTYDSKSGAKFGQNARKRASA
jgi:hypothetical protein